MKSINVSAAVADAFSAFDDDYIAAEEPATQTVFFDNVTDAINSASPQGSSVCAYGFDNTDMFLRAGYRVVQGDADIAIVRGGMREFSSTREHTYRKLILCPTNDLFAAAAPLYLSPDGAFCTLQSGQKPHCAVFEPAELGENAAVFAELSCIDLCAFDYAFGACMRGERIDENIERSAAELVQNLTKELCGREKDNEFVRSALIRAGKTAARLVENTPALMFASGAAQAAEALRMMYIKEERTLPMRAEAEFMLAPYIISLYIKRITKRADVFLPPPDNNRRIDCVCEYLGGDLVRTCLHVTPILPPRKLMLYEYRLTEFRAELLKKLTAVKARHTAAWNVFKRLYPDDGFGLKSLIDKTDVGLCISLAPDVLYSQSMLDLLKQSGELEKYLI